MPDRSFLAWPFFEDRHRDHAARLEEWCAANLPVDHGDVDAACCELVEVLGKGGWLRPTAIDPDDPGAIDVRTLCLTRETLARHDGTGAISLFGTPEQREWAGQDARRQGDLRLRAFGAAFRVRRRQHGNDGET